MGIKYLDLGDKGVSELPQIKKALEEGETLPLIFVNDILVVTGDFSYKLIDEKLKQYFKELT